MENARHEGKIFAIGLSRTGTKSLAVALNHLGIRTKWYPNDATTYRQLVMGDYRLSILEEYQAITDTPVVPFYPQLDELYPGSKFILTIREKASWLRSCESHWKGSTVPPNDPPFWRRFANYIDSCVYGCNAFNPKRFSYVYDRHVNNVLDYFRNRPDDLLVLNICAGEGYEKLCPFLGLETPDDVTFPKENNFKASSLG